MTDQSKKRFEVTEGELLILADALTTSFFDFEVHEFLIGWGGDTNEHQRASLDHRLEEIRVAVGDEVMAQVRANVEDRFRRQFGDRYWNILRHGTQEEKDKVAEEWDERHGPRQEVEEKMPSEYSEPDDYEDVEAAHWLPQDLEQETSNFTKPVGQLPPQAAKRLADILSVAEFLAGHKPIEDFPKEWVSFIEAAGRAIEEAGPQVAAFWDDAQKFPKEVREKAFLSDEFLAFAAKQDPPHK